MSDIILERQQLAKLEGLAIGLFQRGEKSAAHEIRLAIAEIERLKTDNTFALKVMEAKDAEIKKLQGALDTCRELRDYDRGLKK